MTTPKIIYFIKPVGLPGPIKIGWAYKSSLRLKTIARWSPLPLEIICEIEGTTTDEAFLHNCFFHAHSHGEWFFPVKHLTDFISDLCAGKGMEYAREVLSVQGKLKGFKHSETTKQRMRQSHQQNREYRLSKLKLVEAA